MRKQVLSFLGAAALALSIGSASPMMVTFSGETGKLIEVSIQTERLINPYQAGLISHVNDIAHCSCDVQILQNGQDGDIVLYLTWRP